MLHRRHLRIRRNLTVTMPVSMYSSTDTMTSSADNMPSSSINSINTMPNIHNSRHPLPRLRLRHPTTNLRIQRPIERRKLIHKRRMQMRPTPRHLRRLDYHGVLFWIFRVLGDLVLVSLGVLSVVRLLVNLRMGLSQALYV